MNNALLSRTLWGVCATSLSLAVAGCGSENPGNLSATEEQPSSIEFALTALPSTVQCVRVTATPTSGAATVKTGTSASAIAVGTMTPGTYTVSGDAFNVACTSISGAGNWIADPISVTVKPGVTANVTLTFRKNNPLTANANFVNNVQSVAMGPFSSGIGTDGGVLQSGNIISSKVFTRASFNTFDPTVAAGNAVTSLGVGWFANCAARADGTVWCWGGNNYGELGPNATKNTWYTTPVQIPGLSGATQVAAGFFHMCAIATGSSGPGVYCWGQNTNGQLGNGTTTDNATPVAAFTGSFRNVACGAYNSYVTTSQQGYVYGWGSNSYGQLGNGTTTSSLSPVIANGETASQLVTAGFYHVCSLRFDGSVRCWGGNYDGELGNGTTTNSSSPVQVAGLNAKQLSAGMYHTCAITTSGLTQCWGDNMYGAIGDGTGVDRLVPTAPALGGVAMTQLSTGLGQSTCGIAANSDVYCWGLNSYGQLGDGTSNSAFLPVKPVLQ